MKFRTFFLATLALSAFGAAAGCSSEDAGDPSANCGPGTALQAGKCVPAATCGAGTVNVNGECVAEGGSSGAGGGGGVSGSSGAAGSSGSAGDGGSSGASGSAVAGGGSGMGGASGAAGAAGDAGAAGSAGSAGGSMWMDDPCTPSPNGIYLANPDSACGTVKENGLCSKVTMNPPIRTILSQDLSTNSTYIRTPSLKGGQA